MEKNELCHVTKLIVLNESRTATKLYRKNESDKWTKLLMKNELFPLTKIIVMKWITSMNKIIVMKCKNNLRWAIKPTPFYFLLNINFIIYFWYTKYISYRPTELYYKFIQTTNNYIRCNLTFIDRSYSCKSRYLFMRSKICIWS